jgi:spore germination protein KC
LTTAARKLRASLVALFLIIPVLMCGCWDRREIEILAFVNAVGIDRADSGNLLVSFYTINPGALGKQPGGGGSEPPAYVTSIEAHNIQQAVARFSEESPRMVRFRQLQAIIVGEDLARQGVGPVVDYFSRREDSRRSIWVLVARGSARDILVEGQAPPEELTSDGIRTIMERRPTFTSTRYPIALGDFLTSLVRIGHEPIASSVELNPVQDTSETHSGNGQAAAGDSAAGGQRRPVFSGAGVFRGDRLLDFLGPTETRGVLWLQGDVRGGEISIPADSQEDWASLSVERESTDVRSVVEGDRIRFIVNIFEEGYITSVNSDRINVDDPVTLAMLEREKEEAIRQEVMSAVARAQSLQSDFLRLGDRLYRARPDAWEKFRDDWNEGWFPRVEVEVNVECQLRHIGNTADPLPPAGSNR